MVSIPGGLRSQAVIQGERNNYGSDYRTWLSAIFSWLSFETSLLILQHYRPPIVHLHCSSHTSLHTVTTSMVESQCLLETSPPRVSSN